MMLEARSWKQEPEMQFIESLCARYEGNGFVFTADPDRTQLPEFFGSYVPHAIALKPGHNLAIEVKQRQNQAVERPLKSIRRLFEGHSDWQFHVISMGADLMQLVHIPSAGPAAVLSRMAEVRALVAEGHRGPALIMAWSLLEAALRSLDENTFGDGRPRTPETVIQTLAMNGYIEPDMERRMWGLIDMRNRIVHGDLVADPSIDDVELLLSGIDEALGVSAV